MANENIMAQSHLQVQTDLNALNQVLEWFDQVTASFLSEERLYQCKIALTEGFTNVVRHAHRSLSETTPIDIEVTVFPHTVEMRVWDIGPPFDLERTLKVVDQLHASDPLKYEGGRGLLFMSKLTDELSYTRMEDNRNCLLMRKKITHPTSVAS